MLKIFSETVRWMKLILCIHVYDIILYINCVVYFVLFRQELVAMAPFSFLWLYLASIQVSVCRTIGPLV